MLAKLTVKIGQIKIWQISLLFIVVGFAVYASSLLNPLTGLTGNQLISNQAVHSFNISSFFGSKDFYKTQKANGINYSPISLVVESLIYIFFGNHPLAFHLWQLALYIATVIILFYLIKQITNTLIALALSLLLLTLPLNSQLVFAVSALPFVMANFFGTLALLFVVKGTSRRHNLLCMAALLFALFSQPSGLIWWVVVIVYFLWFKPNAKRYNVLPLMAIVGLYLWLAISVGGLLDKASGAPIDSLSLIGRLSNAPAIVAFYLFHLVYPLNLASRYYWLYRNISFTHFLLPLGIDLTITAIATLLGLRIRKHRPEMTKYYLLFATIVVIGVMPYLQLVPLSATARLDWFFPAMLGLVGMIGVALMTIKINKINKLYIYATSIVVFILLLGLFSTINILRSQDYKSEYRLALSDSRNSPSDYVAQNYIAQNLINRKSYAGAISMARRSVATYPNTANLNTLGVGMESLGRYSQAARVYQQALKYGSSSNVYENLAEIKLVYSTPRDSGTFLQKSINTYPRDLKLWLLVAIYEDGLGNQVLAKKAVVNAAKLGQVPGVFYNDIMSGQRFEIHLLNRSLLI